MHACIRKRSTEHQLCVRGTLLVLGKHIAGTLREEPCPHSWLSFVCWRTCGPDLGIKRAHVKAQWAWRKGQDKGQKEQCHTALPWRGFPRGTEHTGGGTSDSLSFYSGAPQDLRLSCTLHRCVQHGPWCPSEAAREVLERACHPTPLRSPEGLLCLWIVPQARWGTGVCGGRAGTQEVHPRLCPSSAQLCGVTPRTSAGAEQPDPLLAGGARGATSLCTIQPGHSEWPNTVLILSSLNTLKLEVDSKMAFFFFFPSWVYSSETMAKIPKLQCWQLSSTQVNAENHPRQLLQDFNFFTHLQLLVSRSVQW